jgi:hypothetical protein
VLGRGHLREKLLIDQEVVLEKFILSCQSVQAAAGRRRVHFVRFAPDFRERDRDTWREGHDDQPSRSGLGGLRSSFATLARSISSESRSVRAR